MNRKPHDHTALAPAGAREWDKVRCQAGMPSVHAGIPTFTECGRPLVWVRGSGIKAPRWQHVRGS